MSKTPEECIRLLDAYILENTKATVEEHPPHVQNVYSRLKTYVETMDLSKAITSTVGARMQRDLYNTFMMALQVKEPRTSFTAMNILMFVFDYFKDTIFAENYAYRFINAVSLSPQQLRSFKYLMHLFIGTATLGTRRVNLRRVDINLVAQTLNDQTAKDNLIRYYNITTK